MALILLVDDDPSVVARNADALEASGHTVEKASTTAEALRAINRKAPAVVVLEGMLDGSDAGFDLARKLADERPSLPLIMLSRTNTDSDEMADDDQDGWMPVARFMEKPVMPDVLVYEIEDLVGAAH
jgi:DNA-binding response OmpR family regulator